MHYIFFIVLLSRGMNDSLLRQKEGTPGNTLFCEGGNWTGWAFFKCHIISKGQILNSDSDLSGCVLFMRFCRRHWSFVRVWWGSTINGKLILERASFMTLCWEKGKLKYNVTRCSEEQKRVNEIEITLEYPLVKLVARQSINCVYFEQAGDI